MGDFDLVDKPKVKSSQFGVNFDDESSNMLLNIKVVNSFKVILLRRVKM